ncbi:MAG: hypothetical protein ABW126_16045, partial [Candidatus Sedimenticola sp. 4PFRAG1]
ADIHAHGLCLFCDVEASPPLMEQSEEARNKVAQKVVRDIKDFIGVSCRVQIKGVGEVPRSQGKAVRVIDHRKN